MKRKCSHMWKWSILCPLASPFLLLPDQTGNGTKIIGLQNHFAISACICHERKLGYLDSK